MTPELINQLFEIVLIPLFSALTVFAVQWLRAKTSALNASVENELHKKYTTMLSETISKCVIATNQTYVDNLKKENAFTAEAHKEAFKHCYAAVMQVLSDDAVEYLTAAYGDLSSYITNLIEAEVKRVKGE